MEQTSFYLLLSASLFSIGVFGVLTRKNTLVLFMCIELMLNAVNLSFAALSPRFSAITPQVYVFFIMAVAAAEAAVGLGIIVSLFKNFYTVRASEASSLRG
jgi:NADH-quinone oxidoreductase subunit K